MALCWLEAPILSGPSLPATSDHPRPFKCYPQLPPYLGVVSKLYAIVLSSLCWSTPGLRVKTRPPWDSSLQIPHVSSESNSLSPTVGSSAGWSRVPGWAVSVGRVIWGGVVVWDRVGLLAISPSLPKVFPLLLTPQAMPHPLALTYPCAVTHSQRQDPRAYSRELGLSPETDKLPTESSNRRCRG